MFDPGVDKFLFEPVKFFDPAPPGKGEGEVVLWGEPNAGNRHVAKFYGAIP